MSDDQDRLINREQLRELVPVADFTITRWIAAGKFPPPIKFGSRNFWRMAEVEAAIERHRTGQRAS